MLYGKQDWLILETSKRDELLRSLRIRHATSKRKNHRFEEKLKNSVVLNKTKFLLQGQIFFLEFKTARDITDNADNEKNSPFPNESGRAVENGYHVEQGNDRNVVKGV